MIWRLTILKTGSTFPALASERGDFEDWIATGCGVASDRVRILDSGEGGFPAASAVGALVITGSHEMVTDAPGRLRETAGWLRDLVAHQVPTLGICYGHQLLAHALGGRVDYRPGGREVGTIRVRLLPAGTEDPLLGVLPRVFAAQAHHSQYVLRLPHEAVPLASSGRDPYHAVRFAETVWGVQFHPEFSPEVMRRYIELDAVTLRDEELEPERLAASVTASPASGLLRRFVQIAGVASRPRRPVP